MSKKVFILGAGCSARYGYPLGLKLVDELRGFLAKIPGGCRVIQGAVEDAVALAARSPEVDTLDKLVNLAEQRLIHFKAQEDTSRRTEAYTKEEGLTNQQVLNAKIATAALFLDREQAARETTMEGYKELLRSIFGQIERWQDALNASDCSVLTFNYDRLFEIAFLSYFKDLDPKQFAVYGKLALNSGFDRWFPERKRIEVAPDRFCFLKLHGSAGWWAKKCEMPPADKTPSADRWREYWPEPPLKPTDLVKLEQCLATNTPFPPWESLTWQPLIAFPHEKKKDASADARDFVQTPYIAAIWKHAAAVLGDAAEVTVIGYSFPEIDRAHTIENLLRKVSSEASFMIENKDPEAVKVALAGAEIPGRLAFKKRTF